MFTGIVSDIGEIVSVARRDTVRRYEIACGYDARTIELGASIACSGVCLTVVEVGRRARRTVFAVEAAPETLALTTAAGWAAGTRLNLERSLKLGDELGGHLVSGHVDGIATIRTREDMGEATDFTLEAPAALMRFIAAKGSVALDGTSLTVNRVTKRRFSVLLIPHTLAMTTWGERRAGDRINLEIDTLARYVARLAEFPLPRARG